MPQSTLHMKSPHIDIFSHDFHLIDTSHGLDSACTKWTCLVKLKEQHATWADIPEWVWSTLGEVVLSQRVPCFVQQVGVLACRYLKIIAIAF